MSRPQHQTKTVDPYDRFLHGLEAKITGGISPASAMLAYLDWAVHLANSPGKQGYLVQKALRKNVLLASYLERLCTCKSPAPCIEPLPQDKRFSAPEWQYFPFNIFYQNFLLLQQWWYNATTGIHGVSKHHEEVVTFSARQILDIFSPSNFPLTNPEILQATLSTGGMNLVKGYQNFLEDWERAVLQKRPVGSERFKVGKDVAVSPGKVIYRNRLIELIQYSPTTEKVFAEPILIVPAWIMKYYILDLSPNNSMVKYLVDQGHTVFMISWKNPTEDDRDLDMDDYLEKGVEAALHVVRTIVPDQKVHAVGYCIGGTLLSIASAVLARDKKDWLASMTLLAAQTDFTEAGELMLFIDQSQVAYIEDLMWDQGYLDTKQMAGAFQLLRSNDLIWSRMVHDYLLGKRRPMIDLMAWNADATRMPYAMHSQYLEKLFLNNDLAEGRYFAGDRPVSLMNIRVPLFVVGAEKDHVAPWRSVYKINQLTDTDITFLLTSGGHNAGIISEPGHPRRHHRVGTRRENETYQFPDDWYEKTPVREGSWWPTWHDWLAERSGEKTKPPSLGDVASGYAPLSDAPGTYVLEE